MRLFSFFITALLILSPFAAPQAQENIIQPDEITATIYANTYTDETFLENSGLALVGFTKSYGATDLKLEVGIENQQAILNSFSYTYYDDQFEIQLGKFVSKVGVLDFFSMLDASLNPTRIEYYDEDNINVRKKPTLQGQLTYYPDDNSTLRLIAAPLDLNRTRYINTALDFLLDTAVPFAALNTGNDTIDLIAEEVLLPAYYGGAKQATDRYLKNKEPEREFGFDTTSYSLNYLTHLSDAMIGLFLMDGYSNIPLVTFDEDLLTTIEHLNQQDRETYISNYLAKEDNEPIKTVEYARYQMIGFYGETSLNSFGLRGELSFRNQFPFINRYTHQINLGAGFDHDGRTYNNIEVQLSYLPETETEVLYGIWQIASQDFHLGAWKTKLENTATSIRLDAESAWAVIPAIHFSRKNIDITAKYLIHSEDEFISNTAMLNLKVVF